MTGASERTRRGARERTRRGARLACAAALVAAWIGAGAGDGWSEEPDAGAPPALRAYDGRGVYYIEGRVRSPLGALGDRSAFATNRLVLDDAHSRVTVDRVNHRIVFRNEHVYGLNDLVGGLLLVGRGTTLSGNEVPVAVHLKIHKTRNRFGARLHPHPTVREKIASATFEPFDVVLANGESEEPALTHDQAVEAVRDPELTARLAELFMQVTDHLEGVDPSVETAGAPLVDLSFGFGSEKLNMKLARVTLRSTSAANVPLIRDGSLARMLEQGDWEFRVDSLSPYVPKWYFERDFFLFGIENLPAVEPLGRRGLRRGETLVVGLRDGVGYIGVGDVRSEIPDPVAVARAYLEFHFVGGVVAQQLRTLGERLD
jgi:hypothetical protein